MLPFACIMLLCPQASAFSLSMSSTKTTIVAGATGYIGKSVVRESVRQGYKTVALVRDKKKVESIEGQMVYGQFFEGAHVVECDVADPEQLAKVGFF
jgi:divinyl chlorophyllide a 8-vinyl-reductase